YRLFQAQPAVPRQPRRAPGVPGRPKDKLSLSRYRRYNAAVQQGIPRLATGAKIMASKVNELEKRVLLLEQELRDLKKRMDNMPDVPWYRQILGPFKDDPTFDEVVRLGRQESLLRPVREIMA